MLSLRGVSKAFGAVQALREVSVDCRAGEIHALVGENGSGKSTLLGIASGFLAPDEGSVEIGGRAARDGLRRRGDPARPRHGLPDLLAGPRDVRGREPLPRGAVGGADRRTGDMEDWAAEQARRVRARRPADRARGDALARGAAAARGGQGAARRAEGAAAGRADDGARARGGRRSSTHSCSSGAGPASASSTSATGCRRCSASPTGSPFCETA